MGERGGILNSIFPYSTRLEKDDFFGLKKDRLDTTLIRERPIQRRRSLAI